mmetsp:Transcript_9879/g.20965  ORF Transcript_9879/g.20965 Transcript_9879/m.20965 type:complete len:210 (+) Transcript_9879:1135-1764(+)
MSWRRSFVRCEMNWATFTLGTVALPPFRLLLLCGTPLWPTIGKPRPGDVSREEGLLSLSAVEMGPPWMPGVHGVEHSPSPCLPPSIFASSPFGCSSAGVVGSLSLPSSLPSSFRSSFASSFAFCCGAFFALLSLPFLRTSFRMRRREPTSPPSPWERVSESFVAVRPKRPFSSSSPSPPPWPKNWPRQCSAMASSRRAPCSQKAVFCWW